jgi:hypothetical protein
MCKGNESKRTQTPMIQDAAMQNKTKKRWSVSGLEIGFLSSCMPYTIIVSYLLLQKDSDKYNVITYV